MKLIYFSAYIPQCNIYYTHPVSKWKKTKIEYFYKHILLSSHWIQ